MWRRTWGWHWPVSLFGPEPAFEQFCQDLQMHVSPCYDAVESRACLGSRVEAVSAFLLAVGSIDDSRVTFHFSLVIS